MQENFRCTSKIYTLRCDQTHMSVAISISCTKQLQEEPVTENDPEPEFQEKLSPGFTPGTSVKTIIPVWLPPSRQ